MKYAITPDTSRGNPTPANSKTGAAARKAKATHTAPPAKKASNRFTMK
jgi:hypothetical protein